MDLKFINSEYFFILAACIKEYDHEDGYEELELCKKTLGRLLDKMNLQFSLNYENRMGR